MQMTTLGGRQWLLIASIIAMSGCDRPEPQTHVQPASPTPEASGPRFGETASEREVREAGQRHAGLGDMWVSTTSATEHSRPGGSVVNRVYQGQKFTVYEKRGDWYRTTEDGFAPRWTKASNLSTTQPPPAAEYGGPQGYQDGRIAPDAIPNPGEYGLTKADVDILWKGAKLVLQSRPDCGQISTADKSVHRSNTYYVTCQRGGMPENVFFTRAEAEAATGT